MRLREDFLELPNAGATTYAFIEKARAVIIVPITADKQVVMLRQFRYAVDEWCLEVPAGTTSDTGDTPLEEVVAKELKEEIGATFERLERLGAFYPDNAMSSEECHVFLALGVELTEKPKPEAKEAIEILLKPAAEALEMARRGKMRTGPCALGLLLAEPRLRELGLI